METADIDIKELVRIGDKKTFEHLFKLHYSGLCSYSLKFVNDRDIAEEIVQDFFFNYWLKRETIVINGSLEQYFYRSVRNSSLNHLKHLSIRDKYSEHIMRDNSSNFANDANNIEFSELNDKIMESICRLPNERRKIFIMNRYDGLKYKEIAEILNISIKTVENQMGKSLKFLRDALKDYMPIFLIFLGKIIYTIFKI